MDPEIWKLIRSGTGNQHGERTDCKVVQSILAFVPKLESLSRKRNRRGRGLRIFEETHIRARYHGRNIGMDPDLGSRPFGKQRRKKDEEIERASNVLHTIPCQGLKMNPAKGLGQRKRIVQSALT